ncbi:sulfotransferase family protein [Amphritea pacifica]|uniref:Sulfotransferase n=1 Tax=Amphritea pacifica TaxID=2811233 RepID=A0ABS2W7T4_9GAMM|nr:sulfotransferase [Amphritea pacifica]MBN0987768.1 sulfotransferase [Amphritea pacifica]
MSSSIFLFSLPRSGSTYLQRVLATSNDIYTTDEPWVALSLMYSIDNKVYAEYGDQDCKRAMVDFFDKHDIGEFKRSIIKGLCEYYSKIAGGNKYFLDKTPRNLLIANDLCDYAPDGSKFIFLVRHPVAVIESMFKTWGKGGWIYHKYKIDLEVGLESLVKCIKRTKDSNDSLIISYEALVLNPEEHEKIISDFLDVEVDLKGFGNIILDGCMGDPNRNDEIVKTKSELECGWEAIITNSFRKYMICKYVESIGCENFRVLGYNYDSTLLKVKHADVTWQRGLFRDLAYYFYGLFYIAAQPRMAADALARFFKGRKLYIFR